MAQIGEINQYDNRDYQIFVENIIVRSVEGGSVVDLVKETILENTRKEEAGANSYLLVY